MDARDSREIRPFNPVPTRYADFAVRTGDEILRYHRAVRSEVGGALAVLDGQPDVRLKPTYSARSTTSGGTLAGADWRRIAREPLDAVARA